MDRFVPVILAFLLATVAALLVSGLLSWGRTRGKIIKSLYIRRQGLADTKRALGKGPTFWLSSLIISLAITLLLGWLSFEWLFRGIQEVEAGGVWFTILTSVKDAWGKFDFPGENYRVIPCGVLFAIFLGLMIGSILGGSIARKQVAKSFLLTAGLYR